MTMAALAKTALEFRLLAPELAEALGDFFECLSATDASSFFHPHPLTREQAKQLCDYSGRDLYFAGTYESRVLAYGLLRGWDEGYAVPSLGIAIAPQARGTRLARSFMLFLHSAARMRGCERIRLTVFRENTNAVSLYQSLGYRFEPKNAQEEVGIIDLRFPEAR